MGACEECAGLGTVKRGRCHDQTCCTANTPLGEGRNAKSRNRDGRAFPSGRVLRPGTEDQRAERRAEGQPLNAEMRTLRRSGDPVRRARGDPAGGGTLASPPIHAWEKDRYETYPITYATYQADLDAFQSERKKILNDKKKTLGEKANELKALGLPPIVPPSPILVAGEPTYEGLFRMLREGPRGVGIFSTEGGQFVGGFAMSEDQRMRTASALSEGWDGLPFKRVRGGDGLIVVHNRRVTLNLMIQPIIVPSFLGDEFLINQGLIPRCLVTAPPSAMGSRFFQEPAPESWEALRHYEEMVLELLRRADAEQPQRKGVDPRDEPLPVLELEPDARARWISFADHIERQLGRDGALVAISGFANKAPEHAARIAGSLRAVEDPEARRIPLECLERGILLVEHYIGEHQRLRASAQVSEPLRRAARLLAWLHDGWTESIISLVEIYRLGPAEFRDKESAAETVRVLEEHGWLRRLDGPREVKGVKRREVWQIVREEAR
jgi:Protein of unknown function (DUF3987)